MTIYKPGTNIRFTDNEIVELTLARLERIARKGVHSGRYIFYDHEVSVCLQELVKEIKDNMISLLEEMSTASVIDYKEHSDGSFRAIDVFDPKIK